MRITADLAIAADRILTCAPLECRNEDACFALARYVKAAQKRYGVVRLPPVDDRLPVEAIEPPIPHWEMTFRD